MMNFMYSIYYWLPDFSRIGIAGKAVNKIMAMVLKRIFDATVPRHYRKTALTAPHGINTAPRDTKYIVSLTSFPARINNVWITVETILRQSFKPDAVILWLAETQFPDKKLPESLTRLQARGLTIAFCADDMRSHKKYLYTLDRYPNDYIITLDDDLYYDRHLLKNLVGLKNQFPDAVATNRAHKLKFGTDGNILPYRMWLHNVAERNPSHLLVQTGGFGTIYKKSDLYIDVNNTTLIKTLAFHADDLWLKMMVYMQGKKVVTNTRYNKDPLTVGNTQVEKLVTTNVLQGGNDQQLKNIMLHYGVRGADIANPKLMETK